MRALLFTSIYPSLREPTRGPYNHSVFRAVAARCEARVVSPQPFWTRLRRRPAELLRAPREAQTGIETTLPAFWSVPRATALHGPAMYASLLPYVSRLRREFPFDVILAAWAYPDAVAAAHLARDFRCPLVVKILGSDINELPRQPALRRQIRAGLERASYVVTVSAALRERVLALGIAPERVLVQHNGVDGEKFAIRDRREVRERLGIPEGRPCLCYIGRLGREKGIDVLVDAMGQLASDGRRDIDLHVVGGGEEGEALRAQTRALGLEAQIHFHGMRPHAEVPLWISACDVLCLPSRREGCPNVILEALASGRPVVASRVGGVPELLCDDEPATANGGLVPSEDPAALAQGLRAALERPWDAEALRASVEYLSWDAVGENYYRTLVAAVAEAQSAGGGAPTRQYTIGGAAVTPPGRGR